MTTEDQPTIGHNVPPTEGADLLTALEFDHAEISTRSADLTAALERVPEEFGDRDTAMKATDFIKQLTSAIKAIEATRVAVKDPYLAAGKLVDSFFHKLTQPIEQTKATVANRLTSYQRRVAEAERVRKEEEALKERERAETERKKAEEARAEKLRAEEAARKLREEAEAAEARAADAKTEAEASAHRAEATQHQLAAASEEVRADQETDLAVAATAKAEDHADASEQARQTAQGSATERSRVRADLGAVGSLRKTWAFEVEDFDAIPLARLRPHFATADIEKAIRGYIRQTKPTSGGWPENKKLTGVRIFETQKSVVS